MLWTCKVDDDLTVTDDVAIGGLATVGGTLGVTGVLTTTAATVFNGGFASNANFYYYCCGLLKLITAVRSYN